MVMQQFEIDLRRAGVTGEELLAVTGNPRTLIELAACVKRLASEYSWDYAGKCLLDPFKWSEIASGVAVSKRVGPGATCVLVRCFADSPHRAPGAWTTRFSEYPRLWGWTEIAAGVQIRGAAGAGDSTIEVRVLKEPVVEEAETADAEVPDRDESENYAVDPRSGRRFLPCAIWGPVHRSK